MVLQAGTPPVQFNERGTPMQNFYYSIPTEIYFGKGEISHLGEAVSKYGRNALLVYGGGSIKKLGLYDEALRQLSSHGVAVTELAGVEPNPKITSVRKGVDLCREKGIDVVLPIGGGSTIDCAKVIAAGAKYDGDAWDLVTDPGKIADALPIVSVLTLAATGSEMDPHAVISDMEANDKLCTSSPLMKPKASVMDPTYTFSVSKKQTAAGTADIMSHTFESYFNPFDGAYVQNSFSEVILKTCIKYGPIALREPDNYEARANLMWASSLAINGILSLGAPVAWVVHPIEHELSAFYDITHGEGLAIITPRWMRYILSDKTVDKFAAYGINVWGIDASLDRFEIANKAIDMTYDFFVSLGIPMTLKEVGIGEEKLEIMAKKAAAMGLDAGYVPLNADDVLKILRACL